MPHNYVSSMAVCPFYCEEQPRVIFCEGPFPGSSLRLGYRGSAAVHKENYCRGRWEDCPIAKMLWTQADGGPMVQRKGRGYPGAEAPESQPAGTSRI